MALQQWAFAVSPCSPIQRLLALVEATAEHDHHHKLMMCTHVAPAGLTRSLLCREELEAASQGKDLFAEDW